MSAAFAQKKGEKRKVEAREEDGAKQKSTLMGLPRMYRRIVGHVVLLALDGQNDALRVAALAATAASVHRRSPLTDDAK